MIWRNSIILGIFMGMLCLPATVGCSGAKGDSASPVDSPVIQAPPKEAQSGRQLWGVWQFSFDESMGELTPIALREAYAHFNVTPFLLPPNCTDCLKTEVNSFDTVTRILDADVTLRNPTMMTGFDVRGILFTDDYGHELTNPDDWTGLWDIAGGQTINPFKAFATSVFPRLFAPGAKHTVNYLIHIPIPAKYNQIAYAVDASWPENCKEPYAIDNFTQEELFDTGAGQAMITVDIHDWQDDVNKVTLACKTITGADYLQLYKIAGDTWGTYIKNNAGAPVGEYKARFIAASAGSGVALYDFATITITEKPTGWARTWGGSNDDLSYGVAVDGYGNTYVTGTFLGTADFDPGTGTDEHTSNGPSGIFLSKFGSSGDFQWARTWGGEISDWGNAVAVDSYGNIYVTGAFAGTGDFDPGGGTDEHTSASMDAFLSKFGSDGDFQWARTWGGDIADGGYGVATDGSGNIYLIVRFYSTVDFDPGAGSDEHTSNGSIDISLSKFNSSGDFQWARTWGGIDDDYGYGVAVDESGNIYTTGGFKNVVDFDPGDGTDEHTPSGDHDIFLSSFDPGGVFQWVRIWGGGGDDHGTGVALDGAGNIYVTGWFDGTTDFDPGSGTDEHTSNGYDDAFLSKFDSSGNFQWARTWGGEWNDPGNAVAVDDSGNISVTGWFDGTTDFDPGSGTDEHTAKGQTDIFLSKFNSSGDYQWARTWGADITDGGYGVATDDSGSIYVTGWFNGTVDFDPGDGTDEHTSNNGLADIFLSKFPPDGNW